MLVFYWQVYFASGILFLTSGLVMLGDKIMKKEEILEKSRKENKDKDYAAIEVENKATKIAALAIVILASIYYISGIVITGNDNKGWYSIIAIFCAILYGYKGIKLHKKFDIVVGIIWLIVSILLIVSYMHSLITGSTIL